MWKGLSKSRKSGMLVMISPLGKVYDLPTTWTRGFCKQHWQLTSSQNSPEDDWATWFMRLWVFVRASNFFNPKWVVYILGRCHSVCAVCLSSRFCGGSCAHGIVQFFRTSYVAGGLGKRHFTGGNDQGNKALFFNKIFCAGGITFNSSRCQLFVRGGSNHLCPIKKSLYIWPTGVGFCPTMPLEAFDNSHNLMVEVIRIPSHIKAKPAIGTQRVRLSEMAGVTEYGGNY